MIVVAVVEALVLLAVVWMLTRRHDDAERSWTVERRELLNRIQRPERLPAEPVPEYVIPEREDDEINQVGMVAEYQEPEEALTG